MKIIFSQCNHPEGWPQQKILQVRIFVPGRVYIRYCMSLYVVILHLLRRLGYDFGKSYLMSSIKDLLI